MKRLNPRLLALACVTVGLVASTAAFAGLRTFLAVQINDSVRIASGMLGAARNTSDTTQYIGCRSVADNFGQLGMCFAVDSAQLNRSCTTTNANMIATIRSIAGDSFVQFNWDANGQCTGISVLNESDVQPKGP